MTIDDRATIGASCESLSNPPIYMQGRKLVIMSVTAVLLALVRKPKFVSSDLSHASTGLADG